MTPNTDDEHGNVRHDRIRLLLAALICLLGFWIAFGTVIVPRIIDSAYHHTSVSWLNEIFQGRTAKHPVDHYQQMWQGLWRGITEIGAVAALALAVAARVASTPRFFQRYVGEATPGALGAIRMLTCGSLLLATLLDDPAHIAVLPSELRSPMGIMDVLYRLPIGFDRFVADRPGLGALESFTTLILFLGMIGWRTRIVLPLGALCYLVLGGIDRQYSHFYHQGLLPLYLMAVLSCTPCGDGWSVDRLWNVLRGRSAPEANGTSPVYGWSRYACWVVIALCYASAGLSKLRDGGLFWWNGAHIRQSLYADTLQPGYYGRFHTQLSLQLTQAPDSLFAVLGLVTLLGELLFVLVLFSRIARGMLPLLMIMVHTGIFFLQNVWFLDLILLQFVFFDLERIPGAAGKWLASAHGRVEVLYDGLCPLCRRTVRVLRCVDLLNRLKFMDFRVLDLARYNRSRGFNLTPRALEEEMYVVSRGRAYQGFSGYRVIALALPVLWPIAPWLFLPGTSFLGAMVYRRVATNRFKPLKCGPQCGTGSSGGSESTVTGAASPAPRARPYALAVSGVAVALLLFWFHRIEYYPLTAWQMYADSTTSSQIQYVKVLAHRESGVTSPASFEEMGRHRSNALFSRCFSSEEGICERAFEAIGSAYNATVQPGRSVKQFEIQQWTWDFRANPTDPAYGTVVDRIILRVGGEPQSTGSRQLKSIRHHRGGENEGPPDR